jgi:signal-transduction protein with cAMP-binding, CBS, and nucleotidyltransferase domain
VYADEPAAEAAQAMARINVRAVVVLNRDESLAGVVSDSMLLRMLLPPYVEEAERLAGVLGEKAAEELWRRLEGKTAQDLIPSGQRPATIDADDTLIEVAAVMVRTRAPVVAVRQGNQISGVVTIEDLLARLMTHR